MKTVGEVPAWFVVGRFDRVVDGPFFLQSAAWMRLASFPGGRVVKRMVKDPEFVEERKPS